MKWNKCRTSCFFSSFLADPEVLKNLPNIVSQKYKEIYQFKRFEKSGNELKKWGNRPKILGNYWYSQYAENGSIKNDMKNYMNEINPRNLYYEDYPDTVLEQLITPPELHILIGFVKILWVLLLDAWPGFNQWLVSNNIFQQGYQGRGWDGNNSNKSWRILIP